MAASFDFTLPETSHSPNSVIDTFETLTESATSRRFSVNAGTKQKIGFVLAVHVNRH